MAKKEKIYEMDFVRAVAILAVLTIHSTADGTLFGSSASTVQHLMKWFNGLSVFAVPVFLFVSGLVLFYNYEDKWGKGSTAVFFRKRLKTVLIPYLAYSVMYHMVYGYFYYHDAVDTATFFRQLWQGSASYHLYFMVILFQFYILFPFAMTILTRWPSLKKWFWLPVLAVQAAYVYKQFYIEYYFGVREFWLNFWIYFFLGGCLGLYYGKIKPWLVKLRVPLLAVTAAVGIFQVATPLYTDLVIRGAKSDTLFRAYGLLCGLALLSLGILVWNAAGKLKTAAASLGRHSFGIYLIHPLFQTAYGHILPAPAEPKLYLLHTLCKFVFILSASWLASVLYSRVRDAYRRHRTSRSAATSAQTPAG